MSRQPPLYLVEGSLTREDRRIYRLRDSRSQQTPAQEVWPKAGAWRDLVRKLQRNLVKGEES
jgi:hypothetical protein